MPKPKSLAAIRIRAEVIRLVGLIPAGKFTTYGSIAIHMNVAVLHVSSVMNRLTDDESQSLPWHHVVGADARISPKMEKTLAVEQRRRLEKEGLQIDPEGFIHNADNHFHRVGVRRNIRWSDQALAG